MKKNKYKCLYNGKGTLNKLKMHRLCAVLHIQQYIWKVCQWEQAEIILNTEEKTQSEMQDLDTHTIHTLL